MIRMFLIVAVAAFTTGFGSGLYFSHSYYRVASLRAQVKFHKDQDNKLREALGLNQQLDDQDDEAEKNNEEVLNAIRSKPVAPVESKCGPVVCVSAERLRDIKRLR